jgi:anti-anti-sigma factor
MTKRWPVDQRESLREGPAWDHQFDLTRQMFFWVETAELDDSVIIVVGGAIDVPTADRFADALQFALARGGRVIVVDISQVECFADAGVHVLETARQLAVGKGRTLRMVVDERGLLVRLLGAAGLTGNWQMFRELSSALEQGSDAPGEVVCFG